jgi:hypothetical protein
MTEQEYLSQPLTSDEQKDIAYIDSFLKESNIQAIQVEPGVFEFKSLADKVVQIRYGSAERLRISYKRFGNEGVKPDYALRTLLEQEALGKRVIYWRNYEMLPRFGKDSVRKNEVIKSYIVAAAGIPGTKVYARDTEVREITNREAKPFLEKNSFYGYRGASLTYGLFNKKEYPGLPVGTLLMLTSVGHSFFGRSLYDLEILRSATLLNTQVLGGASKLMSRLLALDTVKIKGEDKPWNSLVYFADLDHTPGSSLENLGFKFWRDSGAGFLNINLKTGNAFNRKPNIHKLVMEWMAKGEVVATPLAGVRTFVYCKNGDYSKYGIKSNP